MNGHAQSGGHWNVAFGLATGSSGGSGPPQWSSRSGDGSAAGILFIIGGTPEGVAQRSHGLRHKTGTGKTPGEGHISSSTSPTIHSIYNRPLFRVCPRLHNCEITLDMFQRGADWSFTIIAGSVRE